MHASEATDGTPMDEPTDPDQARAPESTAGPARAALTRVAVPARIPEPAADWCRHEVRRLVAGHLLGTAAILWAAVAAVLHWQDVGFVSANAFGALIGLAGVAARVLAVLVVGPLGMRYVRRYSAGPPEYVRTHSRSAPPLPEVASLPDIWELDDPSVDCECVAVGVSVPSPLVGGHSSDQRSDPGGDHAGESSPRAESAAVALREMGLPLVAAVRTDGRPSSVVDLFSDGDRIVAAVDRTSGSITLLTELAGFRVLVTSALLVPPTDDLVVNVVDDDAPSALVVSHRRLVQAAVRSRALASDPVGLFKLAQQRELEAYRQLGPFWGAMLDLRCRPGGARLLSAPSAQDVLLFTGNRLFQQTR